ncbi:hypothetical protein [Streptomyces filamentosus]|uniref:hypothetical protein n=1 Tax=Streptomyces filamentosus TaxID=67294 RepID=UPI0037D55B9C
MTDLPPGGGPLDPHDGPCELHDYLALADDEELCCVRHHPEGRRHPGSVVVG